MRSRSRTARWCCLPVFVKASVQPYCNCPRPPAPPARRKRHLPRLASLRSRPERCWHARETVSTKEIEPPALPVALFVFVAAGCGGAITLCFRERDQRLEPIAARFAFPEMAHAMAVEILRPFRQEDRLPALRAVVLQPAVKLFARARCPELHDVSSRHVSTPSPRHGSSFTIAMKQQS